MKLSLPSFAWNSKVGTQNPNALFVERSDQRHEISVSCHEHGNVDLVAEADLQGIDGKGHIDALLTARLRHGQVLGLNPRMH